MNIAASRSIGISDIGLYLPASRLGLDELLKVQGAGDPAFARRLGRAIELTGQKAIRFPSSWEDTASMAANAVLALVGHGQGTDLSRLRHIVAGTETTVDFSKPISAWVQGMLQKAGFPLGQRLSTSQVQHACAGASLGLLATLSQLLCHGRPSDSALILASDIARYEVRSTAEITQGAGAVALLVEQDPKLLAIDMEHVGFASADVDDFFRPLDSITARVKGQYSIQCYHEAASTAFLDFCDRRDSDPRDVIEEHEYMIFHVPFAKMAYTAARHLLSQQLGLLDGEIDAYLDKRGFFEALEATADTGNIYSGATYLNLANLLHTRWKALGTGIVGKKVLVLSYGSGNTMAVYSATVAKDAPAVIASWDLDTLLASRRDAPYEEYVAWTQAGYPSYPCSIDTAPVPSGLFHLESIREDGYRLYARKA